MMASRATVALCRATRGNAMIAINCLLLHRRRLSVAISPTSLVPVVGPVESAEQGLRRALLTRIGDYGAAVLREFGEVPFDAAVPADP